MTGVKYTREQVADGVGAVLDALKRPRSGQLVTAEETGLDGAFLLDLYATGYLWIARRDNGVVFGVTRQGRAVWADVQSMRSATDNQPRGGNG